MTFTARRGLRVAAVAARRRAPPPPLDDRELVLQAERSVGRREIGEREGDELEAMLGEPKVAGAMFARAPACRRAGGRRHVECRPGHRHRASSLHSHFLLVSSRVDRGSTAVSTSVRNRRSSPRGGSRQRRAVTHITYHADRGEGGPRKECEGLTEGPSERRSDRARDIASDDGVKARRPAAADAGRGVVGWMGLGRVELPTSRLSGVRSNHLSYRPCWSLAI